MNDYYQEISCGKFQVTGKAFEPVTVSKKRERLHSTPNRGAMLTEALDLLPAAKEERAQGVRRSVYFIYAGTGCERSAAALFWPHRRA